MNDTPGRSGALRFASSAFALSAALQLACTPPPPGPPTGSGATEVATIGAAGGAVELEGTRLEVPAEALASDVSLSMTSQPTPAPESFEAVSPVFKFEPEGTHFAVPAVVKFQVAEATPDLRVFWSKAEGAGFDQLATTRDGYTLSATVTHFSEGFAAPAQPDATEVPAAQCVMPPTDGSCVNITAGGSMVVEETSNGTPPIAIGGTIVPGRYLLKKKTAYVPPNVTVTGQARQTLEFCGDKVQSISTDDVDTRKYSGTFSVSGTSVSFSLSCPSALSATQGYTATSTALFLFEDHGMNGTFHEWTVSEYHRQ